MYDDPTNPPTWRAEEMLLNQKEVVHAKIRSVSKSHIVHDPPFFSGDMGP